jgi:peptidyl-prolyl cis-trans isomerase C
MRKLILVTFASAVVWAQAPAAADPVVITVGSEKITKSVFEAIIAGLNDQQRAALEQQPEAKRSLAEQIVELKMMAQEGRARRLDQQLPVQAKIVLQAEQVLANAVYQEMLKTPPSDADIQAFYKEHQNEWLEAKGRHILVRFEGSRVPLRDGTKELTDAEALAKANQIRDRILAGAKFADLAKTESDDEGSGENGGDLGSFGPGQMVEPFDQIAFTITPGEVSEPVKTDFGYHLIMIDSRSVKQLDEVRDEIEGALRPQIGQNAIAALKAKSAVTYDDSYFGKPADENQ